VHFAHHRVRVGVGKGLVGHGSSFFFCVLTVLFSACVLEKRESSAESITGVA